MSHTNPTEEKESRKKSILLATEVPFWRQQTGAQQRITSLVQFLAANGWKITCAYLGSLKSASETAQAVESLDRDRIQLLNLNVISLIDDWQPDGLLEKVSWQWKCIRNMISNRMQFGLSSDSLPVEQSRLLSDFEDAELKRRFQTLTNQIQPDSVICEYITLSYLVPPKNERKGVSYWVDTHDFLSFRCAQFRERGLVHWINISEAEEAEALKTFDGIIAIEASEAQQFQMLTDNRLPVVVAGFSPSLPHTNQVATKATQATPMTCDSEIKIGIIASENAINLAGLEWFLIEVWPRLNSSPNTERTGRTIKLVLAGSICSNQIVASHPSANLNCLGPIDQLEEFYDQIQIAINPVQFGTGLKIKSVEALAYGKPLIAHRHCVAGLPGSAGQVQQTEIPQEAGQGAAVIVVDSADAMVAAIMRLAQERNQLEAASAAARQFAQSFLNPDSVYGELLNRL